MGWISKRNANEQRDVPLPSVPPPPDAASSHPPDSIELVRLGKEGDRWAVNEFVRRYQPRLRRVVRIRMGELLRRHVDPDDIVQEATMIAVDKLSGFEAKQRANILHWLTKISDNVISNKRDMILAQKRDPRLERSIKSSESSPQQSGVILPDDRPTPSQVLSEREQNECVDACVEALEPDAYRQVILMRDYCDTDWESIRVELDRPTVDSVRELHRRARAKLAEEMARFGIV